MNTTKIHTRIPYYFTILIPCLLLLTATAYAQTTILSGTVHTADGHKPLAEAVVTTQDGHVHTLTDVNGQYQLKLPAGVYTLVAFALGRETATQSITVASEAITVNFILNELARTLDEVSVQAERERTFGITRLRSVEGTAIYEGKKSEVVVLRDLTANKATNNARQVFSKVTGLNIWESDGAGLQLGIGGRGLSPNRTSNFNTRQNGYDISADALGYPESYYTPPVEALDRIEVVRGAASLQYGTQFGGLLNFRFQRGPRNKSIELTSRQTLGSWGFFGSFNSIGGTVDKGKLNYYAFYQHKQGNGWRPNSQFNVNTAYGSVHYRLTPRFTLGADYTFMHYEAQQPGGLTDTEFAQNPRQSIRARNWFRVNWNLFALTGDYQLADRTKLNTRFFGLLAGRSALGNLERINVADLGGNRNLIDGTFHNIGNETRLLHRYQLLGQPATLLVGFRWYRGTTTAQQGDASNGSGSDFRFLHPNDLENSDYRYPNKNDALFAEHIINLNSKLSITPGVRVESIRTFSSGFYRQRTYDFAGNIISDEKFYDDQVRRRAFVLVGAGLSYKPTDRLEVYANISQNYRAINFSDLRITNPNFAVDPKLHDERGYTADLGIRGRAEDFFTYELTLFYLKYKDRIGLLLKADQPPLYLDYRLRTNISDSRNLGIEAFGEIDLLKMTGHKTGSWGWSVFANLSLIDARYINTEDPTIRNKLVEQVPPVLLRTGTTIRRGSFSATLQYAYTGQQFTDATNAIRTSTAVNGVIPAYQIMDLSAAWHYKWLLIEGSCNNLLNTYYFTRRADSYPGPGIIPADGRAFYLTVGARF
ncbi:TonB-dependent receptor [Spirosoma sp. SC4-14]|uniref:TonB-dependent receptor n=1 Tax=Spirosoma sp. SC4-14 TaxID=3128900 RepID=UPI0030D22E72